MAEVNFEELKGIVRKLFEEAKVNDHEWKLEIRKVENGFVLAGRFGDSEEIEELVVEEEEESSVEAGANLLWEVMDYFNLGGSKHDATRLGVAIDHRIVEGGEEYLEYKGSKYVYKDEVEGV